MSELSDQAMRSGVGATLAVVTLAVAAFFGPLIQDGAAGSRKPEVLFRVHDQTDRDDSGKFAIPLESPSRPGEEIFVGKIPVVTERDITGIHVYDNERGAQGVAFLLNAHGRLSLSVTSAQRTGKLLFVFMNGRTIAELYIDRHVQDGILNVPRGWLPEEIALLRKLYEGEKKRGDDGREPSDDAGIGRQTEI